MKVMFVGSVNIINTSVETYLTKGKWYDIIPQKTPPDRYYVIQNDYAQERRYKTEYFLTLQQLRDNKLTDLGI